MSQTDMGRESSFRTLVVQHSAKSSRQANGRHAIRLRKGGGQFCGELNIRGDTRRAKANPAKLL
eukprot:CAMPEP_0177438486 /NCGR_PEP_ID=MMETSP0369-20130122/2785_1 /TAXON_ID=447022 ORGANISM="Scrippsiella hangoei-like, Strain SHHI-4" /NCGR_SAMPLE_ID=MMETSP0369 /ASSEMBLY_ACC=CAM_ASM_000364 /LENGTH=63 /DNA_ID=CAMNT_0018910065 /DNA_START=165 /DNA_END=353 /DNA_ORIENTATION=+